MVGYATSDGAIGFITDEVFKAAKVFPETDYILLGESYIDVKRFDSAQSTWKKINDVIWCCKNCGHELVHVGLWVVDYEQCTPLCVKCNSMMQRKTE